MPEAGATTASKVGASKVAASKVAAKVAIDIGGTFTDIALATADGRIHQSKISSTPDDPSRAVIEGVAQLLAELGLDPAGVSEVMHGTTVGSNTILQRTGARTGLITTQGFRDVLEIGRIRMPDMFDLTWVKPRPLVPRRHRLEVAERMAADGSIVTPLDEAGVVEAGRALVADGIEAIAIAFLNSYRNPAHEQRAEALLRAAIPGLLVTSSCAVLPEIKEYERTSTTVVNAYLLAAMQRYLQRLETGLRDIGVAAPILVMTSNGGMLAAKAVVREAGARRRLRSGRRRDRRRPAGGGARRPRRHRFRYGRHDGQGGDRRGRAADHDVGVRISRRHLDLEPVREGRRLHAQGAGDRHRRGGRRRRIDRGHRQGRPAGGRSAVGRRDSGSRLLRPRQ